MYIPRVWISLTNLIDPITGEIFQLWLPAAKLTRRSLSEEKTCEWQRGKRGRGKETYLRCRDRDRCDTRCILSRRHGRDTREISSFPRWSQCVPLRANTKLYSRNGKVGEKGGRGNYRVVSVSLVTSSWIGNGIIIGFIWRGINSRRSDRNRFATRVYDRRCFSSSTRRTVPRETRIDITGAEDRFGSYLRFPASFQ